MLSSITATGIQDYRYSFADKTHNLFMRRNVLNDQMESFFYDIVNLDRLDSVMMPVSTFEYKTNLKMGYTSNKNGNIEYKSDAGTFAYDDPGRPYFVTSITTDSIAPVNNIDTTKQIIDYYSFEKVKKITEGTKTTEFDYNADHQRIRMVLKDDGITTKTRYYFGGSCEREVINGITVNYIWIGGDAYTAVAVAKKTGTGNWTIYNIFRDHIGTITHLKDAATGTVTEYSFDAWGRRRNAKTWSNTLDENDKDLFADRGFTGHEYLEDFKLYNMNGRLYDPVVGRFLSPDPYIQDPSNTQSYNRYSYCLNNPLTLNDPSGYK